MLGQPSRLVLELAPRPCHLRRVEERREREPAQAGELRRERRLCEALAAACVHKMAGVAAQVSHAELDGRWGHVKFETVECPSLKYSDYSDYSD